MERSKPGNRPIVAIGEPRDETPTAESRAERLVAEYLRVWGLRDPQTIATLSGHWVRSAVESQPSLPQNASLTELYRAVMRRAIGDMERWLDHLTAEVSAGPHDARSRRGLLAIELQTIIDQFPAALLDEGSLPAALREQLASAALSVVPACCPTHMPTQSLAAVSSPRQLSRWWHVWNRLWARVRGGVSSQASQQS